MAVLLLRLAGPLQSWGIQSRFTERDTGREPSKSGVIGLLCAALGRERYEIVDDLASLKMIVRVDNEGVIKKDYHTSMDVIRAHGKNTKDCELSNRYYLSDADFLVALSGDATLLESVHNALQQPHWQIFLGRKSFVPSVPLYIPDGLYPDETDALKILKKGLWPRAELGASINWPLSYRKFRGEDSISLRFITEAPFGEGDSVVPDQPIGASFSTRKFTIRHTKTDYYDVPVRKDEVITCSSLV